MKQSGNFVDSWILENKQIAKGSVSCHQEKYIFNMLDTLQADNLSKLVRLYVYFKIKLDRENYMA